MLRQSGLGMFKHFTRDIAASVYLILKQTKHMIHSGHAALPIRPLCYSATAKRKERAERRAQHLLPIAQARLTVTTRHLSLDGRSCMVSPDQTGAQICCVGNVEEGLVVARTIAADYGAPGSSTLPRIVWCLHAASSIVLWPTRRRRTPSDLHKPGPRFRAAALRSFVQTEVVQPSRIFLIQAQEL